MKHSIKAISLLILFSTTSFASDVFPTTPDLTVTPGKLCDLPVEFRYEEKIPYCGRDVKWETKEVIIKNYDASFGYGIETLPRGEFKIDHLIPLCVGGSNDVSNLWPQHKSVYEITDPLEPEICKMMNKGKLKQIEAVQLVLEAKTHLDRVIGILKYVKSL